MSEVRLAAAADAEDVARLLDAFNREYDDPTPGPGWLAGRLRALLADGGTEALLAGRGPDGVAVLRYMPSLWSGGLECYLAELYVAPAVRGRGLGRALMEAVLARAGERGTDYVFLGTSETDTAARALYESVGFTNREGGPGGPTMFIYERAL